MAFVTALTHLRYSLNNHIVELRRVSNLAATFIIKNELTRMGYLNDIEHDISDVEFRFNNEFNPFKQQEIVFEFASSVELAKREYQILRMKDHVTYYVTDVF